MTQATLLPVGDPLPSAAQPQVSGVPRYQRADRRQIQRMVVDLDSLLPADHRARAVWLFVERRRRGGELPHAERLSDGPRGGSG